MAESRSSNGGKGYGKLLQRNFSRTLERVKSTLGKSDKTSDDEFERLSAIFRDQQAVANRLQRALKEYMFQSNVMAATTEDLYYAMRDAYEPDWEESRVFRDKAERVTVQRAGFLNALHDRVVTKFNNYTGQFPPVKARIAKRSRKLIDYDSSRHRARALEGAKKRNEAKISQAQDNLSRNKHVYDAINQELLREIPQLYQSRIVSLCTCFEDFLNTELEYSTKISAMNKDMADIVSKMRDRAAKSAEVDKAESSRKHVNAYATPYEMSGTSSQSDSMPPHSTFDEPKNGSASDQQESEERRTYENITSSSADVLKKSPISDQSQISFSDTTKLEGSTRYEKNQEPGRPSTGPSGVPPYRPPVNVVGVVADIHKGSPLEGSNFHKSVIQQSSSTDGTDVNVSFSSQSPAVVQQQLSLKKKQEEEQLKQQMLKQRQREEYLKHQQQQQEQRRQEWKRREEEMQNKQRLQQQQTTDLPVTVTSITSTSSYTSNTSITASSSAENTTPSDVVTATSAVTTSSISSPQGNISSATISATVDSPQVIHSDTNKLTNSDTPSDPTNNFSDMSAPHESKDNVTTDVVVTNGESTPTVNGDGTNQHTFEQPALSGLQSSVIDEKVNALIADAEESRKDVVLYTVVVKNAYTGDDNEELTLEPGQVINVLQRNQNDESLDDGWLFGLNTTTKARGLFPANFTSRQ